MFALSSVSSVSPAVPSLPATLPGLANCRSQACCRAEGVSDCQDLRLVGKLGRPQGLGSASLSNPCTMQMQQVQKSNAAIENEHFCCSACLQDRWRTSADFLGESWRFSASLRLVFNASDSQAGSTSAAWQKSERCNCVPACRVRGLTLPVGSCMHMLQYSALCVRAEFVRA